MCDHKRKPCRRGCAREDCPCEGYREWFLRSWKGFNRFAWAMMDDLGREKAFRYAQPHEAAVKKDPCEVCPCRAWCDVPCSLRLKWWDVRMRELRARFGSEEDMWK